MEAHFFTSDSSIKQADKTYKSSRFIEKSPSSSGSPCPEMDSTGSCTSSTAPAADSSLQSLAIHDKGAKLGQQKRPASSRAPPSASKKKAPEMNAEFEFKCDHCPRSFPTAQGCGGHQKAHRHLVKLLRRQNKKSSGSSGPVQLQILPGCVPDRAGACRPPEEGTQGSAG
jgi:hypothetical protein